MSAGNQPGPRARCTFPQAGQQQFWLPEKDQGKVSELIKKAKELSDKAEELRKKKTAGQ